MNRLREIRPPEITVELDDDTDEIELTPEQVRALSLAAAEDDVESSTAEVCVITATPALPAEQSSSADSAWRVRRLQLLVAAFLGIGAVVIVVGSLSRFAGTRNPPVAAVAVNPVRDDVRAAAVLPAPPREPAPPAGPPVRFRNPFDKSEVFEFPAGTSKADARASVAELLLQRARDRQ